MDLRRRIPGCQGVCTSGVPVQSAKQREVYVHASLKESKYYEISGDSDLDDKRGFVAYTDGERTTRQDYCSIPHQPG
jgi:hypothetical protein